jgi:hypothetical protein
MTDALNEFAGSGVGKQKDAETAKAQPGKKATGNEPPEGEIPTAEPGTFDKTGASCVVTHRGGPKRVWYRDCREIGVEDAG